VSLVFIVLGAALIGFILAIIGGGASILSIPLMVYVADVPIKFAIPSALIIVWFTSLGSFLRNLKGGFVHYKIALWLALFGALGGVLGAQLNQYIDPHICLIIFSVLLFVVAVIMFKASKSQKEDHSYLEQFASLNFDRKNSLKLAHYAFLGFMIGLLTGLLGTSGGIFIVPLLVKYFKLPMNRAVPTALMIIFINVSFSISGFMGFLKFKEIPQIVWVIVLIATISGLLSTSLLTKIKDNRLKLGFSLFVCLMGLIILVKEIMYFV